MHARRCTPRLSRILRIGARQGSSDDVGGREPRRTARRGTAAKAEARVSAPNEPAAVPCRAAPAESFSSEQFQERADVTRPPERAEVCRSAPHSGARQPPSPPPSRTGLASKTSRRCRFSASLTQPVALYTRACSAPPTTASPVPCRAAPARAALPASRALVRLRPRPSAVDFAVRVASSCDVQSAGLMTQLVPRGPSSLDSYEDFEANMYDWNKGDKGLVSV